MQCTQPPPAVTAQCTKSPPTRLPEDNICTTFPLSVITYMVDERLHTMRQSGFFGMKETLFTAVSTPVGMGLVVGRWAWQRQESARASSARGLDYGLNIFKQLHVLESQSRTVPSLEHETILLQSGEKPTCDKTIRGDHPRLELW